MADIYRNQPAWSSTRRHQDTVASRQEREGVQEAQPTSGYRPFLLSSIGEGKGSGSTRAATLHEAQKLHGNRAVQRFVQGQGAAITSVQRESALPETWARPWMRPRPSPGPTDSTFAGPPAPLPGYSDYSEDVPREPYDPGYNRGYDPGRDAPGYGGGWDPGHNPGYNGGYRGDFGPGFDPNYDGGYGPGYSRGGWQDPTFGPDPGTGWVQGDGYGSGSALGALGDVFGGIGRAVADTFGGLFNDPTSLWGDLTGGGGGGGSNWEEMPQDGGNTW